MADLCQHLASFAECYDVFHGLNIARSGVADLSRLPERPLDALVLFTHYCHERQGRNPQFAVIHRLALYRSLGSTEYTSELNGTFIRAVRSAEFPSKVWKAFTDMLPKANAKMTQGPVCEILQLLHKHKEKNIFNVVIGMGPFEARTWLRNIRGIGPKVSAFIIRDWYRLAGKQFSRQELVFAQPVDLWVKFWSKSCWPRAPWAGKHDEDARIIVESCGDVDPVAFNKGAWFVGANYGYLRVLHGMGEAAEPQDQRASAVFLFQPNKVISALHSYDGKSLLIL